VNRRTRNRSVAVAAAVAATWALAGVGTADAAAVAEVGWWSRNPLSSAPDGGFAVGAAPDGPTAVAALRVDVGGGVDTLVVDVVPTADAGALGDLEVCTAPDTWTAAAPGVLADAPATACEGDAVPFGRAGDVWRADVSSLVRGSSGTVSLAVVPVAGAGTVPFEVTFEAPSATATGEAPAPAPSTGGALGGGASPPATAPAPAPAFSPPRPAVVAPVPLGGGATGAAPTTTVAPAAEGELDAGAGTAAEDVGAGSTFELADAGLLDEAASPPRWGEALVLVLIGLAVGAGTYGTSRFAASRA